MERTNCPRKSSQDEALYRFLIVSAVLNWERTGGTRPQAVKKARETVHFKVDGKKRTVSTRTIYRWLDKYKAEGFSGLFPKKRTNKEPGVISFILLEFFKEQKKKDPTASIPELIRRAKELELMARDASIDRTTVWRNLVRQGVETSRRKSPKTSDVRRFAHPHRMDMVLCDGKHFRAGSVRLRRVVLFFIDDATRMMLGAVVGTSENAELFLRGLYKVLLAYGRFTALYLDKGPGFIAADSLSVLKQLEILFIHGRTAYPEGHGKIEKFNQTAKQGLIRHFDGNPEIDPACEALELRFEHYLNRQYNLTPHESLNKASPWFRFNNDERRLRFFEDRRTLAEAFVLHEKRRVSKDNVVPVDGVAYEVPPGHAGERLILMRSMLDRSVSIIHKGRLTRLSPVDLNANARGGRCKDRAEESEAAQLPRSSAQIAFEKECRPVIDADGGCPKIINNHAKGGKNEKDR